MKVEITLPDIPDHPYYLKAVFSLTELREQFNNNFKHGGMFLLITEDLKMYVKVKVEIGLENAKDSLMLAGEVVHITPGPPGTEKGVSIQFLEFDKNKKEQLEKFVSTAEELISTTEAATEKKDEEVETDIPLHPDENEDFIADFEDVDDDKEEDIEEPELEITEDTEARVLEEMIQQMGNARLAELAQSPNKKHRLVLLRQLGPKIVPELLKNRDITEFELAEILKLPLLPHTVIEQIITDEEWSKLYQVKLAVFLNPQTPIAIARKYLPYIKTKDLIQIRQKRLVKGELKRMVDKLADVRTKKKQGF